MAIGDPYATVADLKAYFGRNPVSATDAELADILDSASREVEDHCNRQFNQVTSATSRVYVPDDNFHVEVDDFYDSTGLVVEVDTGGLGTFDTTLPSGSLELFPTNGMRRGRPWPYREIHVVNGTWFPIIQYRRSATVRVTAKWGWASVPGPIKRATLIIAAKEFAMKKAPFGVANMSENTPTVKVSSTDICKLVDQYAINHIMGA